ncbi:helix-turn-helix domain-containing protein [Microbacterium sp. MC2]
MTDLDPAEHALGDRPAPRRLNKVQRATRRAEAITLRRAGVRVDTIAERLGVSPRTIQAWLHEAIADIPREAADDLRMLELDRLDALFAAQYRAALAGDGQAVDKCLKVMERRARLLNLDAQHAAGLEAVGSLLDRLVNGEA